MDTSQNALVGTPHRNNGLFADYYLNEIVPTLPEWDEALFAQARTVFHALRELRARTQPAALDEAQLEEQWVRPVLAALGLHYSVQVKIRYRESGHRKPDYVFTASDADARALTSAVYTPDQLRHTLAVGDAKRWGARLDQSAPGQRNPAQQIDEYLRYSELPWGLLTDGRIWRLYHRDTSKYNQYYAVDLDALLESDKISAFLYFYAFFRREAFSTGWLAKVLAGSEDFAQKLTDKLEDEVYDALELIAQGFLEYRRNRLTPDPATLRTIYEESLVLLYRLLFIFYAESRAILPIDQNKEYTDQRSLRAIRNAVKQRMDFASRLHADGGEFYTRLNDLFFVIDSGSAAFDLPPYNGRLFSEVEHPFLRDNAVGDAYLVPALDKLARVLDDQGRRVFVDYRDLEVRHLGSIYEKLLEYELDIAHVPLTLKHGAYVPAADAAGALKQPGQVYLRTGSNERKVTGSYYTPDYVVRFIVEKSIGPLLEAITARHADLDAQGVWQVREAEALVCEVLALNILDPATGSGHFVVDATSYIAEWLTALALRPADLGDEDELIYWKRQVAAACIYAVDINPLAVELAKLSMWLTTLARGKPLSFLDHHLRVGNSLVGASIFEMSDDLYVEQRRAKRDRAAAQAAASGQMMMFSEADFTDGVRFAVAQMAAIETTRADTVADVKRQEQLYAELTARLRVWEQAADVWAARAFGLVLADPLDGAFGAKEWEAIRRLPFDELPTYVRVVVREAQRIAREQHFFHWELAFPEVFFNADGTPKADPGFDAVIGNPPYVRQERIQPIKPYLARYYEVYSGTADLLVYFYERGFQFLRDKGFLGFITANKFMRASYGEKLRGYLAREKQLKVLIDFGDLPVFHATAYPMIAIASQQQPDNNEIRVLEISSVNGISSIEQAADRAFNVPQSALASDGWQLTDPRTRALMDKLRSSGVTLGEYVDGKLYRGIVTGLNEAFIIDEAKRAELIAADPKNAEIIKPYLRGRDVKRWRVENADLYIIFTRRGIDIDAYPAIKSHLEQFREDLTPKKSAKDERGRKPGRYEWYEIQDDIAYYPKFEKPKIIYPDIADSLRFVADDTGYFFGNTAYMVAVDAPSLLAVLNSAAINYFYDSLSSQIRGGYYRFFTQYVEQLPIPDLSADQESALAAIAEAITTLARARYTRHEDFRRTLRAEFGGGEVNTRVALYRWWELADEKALSDEVKRQLGREIPLNKRAEWRGYLADEQAQHADLTAQIVALETRLNTIVYDAFGLDAAERALIEATTKYPYGEV